MVDTTVMDTLMADLQQALDEDARRHRRLCAFGRWAGVLTAHEEHVVRLLVDDRAYNCRQLSRMFKELGVDINDQTIRRHRNRQCCGRETTPQA